MHTTYVICVIFLLALVCAQTPNSTNSDICQRTPTVFRSLAEIVQRRGLYVTAVLDGEIVRLVDNICVTAFPVAGAINLYLFYSNTVLVNGTTFTNYFLSKDVPPGTFRRANPDGTISQRFFSYFKEFTLACTQFEFGVNPSPPLFAVAFTSQPNTADEILQMEEIFRSRGFQNVSLYALPMKMPTQCVLEKPREGTPQVSDCDGENSFLYSEIPRLLGLC